MSSNSKPKTPNRESPTEPFKRAVTGCLRAIARKGELEVVFAAERPGVISGKVRLPEPARKLSAQEAAIVRGHAEFDRAQARLSRPHRASQAGAGRTDCARRVRSGRAGPGRGDRRASDVRRGQEPDGDARRPLPSRQIRRSHRPCRRADRGCTGDAGSRATHRAGAAGRSQAAGRAVAAADRRSRRQGSRSAREADRRSGAVRRRRS